MGRGVRKVEGGGRGRRGSVCIRGGGEDEERVE